MRFFRPAITWFPCRVAGLAALTLAFGLSACGTPSPAATFVRRQSACPAAIYSDLQWLPDGASIIYAIQAGADADIRSVHADGTGDTILVRDADQPQLSPDGTRLLYRQVNSGASDYAQVLDLAMLRTRSLNRRMFQPAWLPDPAGSIAYFGETPGDYYVLPLDGGAAERRVALPADIRGMPKPPAWTSDGRTFAFAALGSQGYTVSIVRATDSRITQVAAPDTGACVDPAEEVGGWSPDGRLLAIIDQCSGRTNLRIVDADGAPLYDWHASQTGLISMAWSPDPGGRIAYVAQAGGPPSIYSARVDGSDSRLLRAAAFGPVWSPDGKTIAFVSGSRGSPDIYRMDADGRNEARLTDNPANHWCPQ